MSLLLNMLSRLVITFLARSKHLLISWLQSPSAVILEPPKIKSDTVSTVSPSISHEVIQSAKTRPGADCGSDHELLIAKFRLKLKKVGKITRPFRYDLNQIPYDYTVEVRNRFKELYLIEFLMNHGQRFRTLYRRQGLRPSPWKRNAKKQNGCLRRVYK